MRAMRIPPAADLNVSLPVKLSYYKYKKKRKEKKRKEKEKKKTPISHLYLCQ
jgi:hypothetical protein